MLLECPNCETVFRINPEDLPAAGRKVQCSVCRHVWQAEGNASSDRKSEPVSGTQVSAAPGKEQARSKGAEPNRALGRVLILLLVVIMLGVVMGIFRKKISAGFPATLPLYEMAGMAITPDIMSLEIHNLAGQRQRDTIRLTGEVFNQSHLPVHAPVFLVTVTSGTGEILHQQELILDERKISGKKAVSFTAQIQLDQDIPESETTDISVVPLPRLPVN